MNPFKLWTHVTSEELWSADMVSQIAGGLWGSIPPHEQATRHQLWNWYVVCLCVVRSLALDHCCLSIMHQFLGNGCTLHLAGVLW